MSTVKQGVRARITHETHDHGFDAGVIVVSTGHDYAPHPRGQWSQFHIEGNVFDTQYLLPEHYEVVATPVAIAPAKVVEAVAEVPAVFLPGKAVYAVVDADDDVMATTADRDYARELKAALGGKRKGIRIFQYGAVKEIR